MEKTNNNCVQIGIYYKITVSAALAELKSCNLPKIEKRACNFTGIDIEYNMYYNLKTKEAYKISNLKQIWSFHK